jgi:hypothetical protein
VLKSASPAIQKLQLQLSRRENEGYLARVLPPRPAPCGPHWPPPLEPAKSTKSPPDLAPARQIRRLVKMVTQLSACQRKAQRQQGVSLCRARDRHRLSDSGIFVSDNLCRSYYLALPIIERLYKGSHVPSVLPARHWGSDAPHAPPPSSVRWASPMELYIPKESLWGGVQGMELIRGHEIVTTQV